MVPDQCSEISRFTAERIGASLAQEFLLGKFTRRGGHMKQARDGGTFHSDASTRNLLATCDFSFAPARDSCHSGPGPVARALLPGPLPLVWTQSRGGAEVRDAFDNFNSRQQV